MTSARKILVVEDSEFVRQIYRVAFRKIGGHEVIHANDGAEGVAALALHERFDLAIVDINMPVMNGLAFIERLRALPQHRATKVLVATTESADGKIRDLVTRAGVTHLRKPFTLERLLEVLKALLPPDPNPLRPGTP